MTKTIKRIASWVVCLSCLLMTFSFSIFEIEGKTSEVKVNGKVYTLESKKSYDYSQSKTFSDSKTNAIGTFSIKGDIVSDGTKNGFASFNATNGEVSFGYLISNAVKNADEKDWHLVSDDATSISGIDLEKKMGLGKK